jgi:hypothetical protein
VTIPKDDLGFVALSSLKKPASATDPAAALAQLRRIYFKTSKKTIEHDFAHAISLLKTIESEEDRRKEWTPKPKPASKPKKKR